MTERRRTALVTGAAGAIGTAVVHELAAKGFSVAGHDRVAPSAPVDCLLVGDLLTDDPREVVREAESALEGLDALVHCAGGGAGADFLDLTDANWDHGIALNLTAAFPLCQAAARGMVDRGGGAIVLVGSLCGREAWRGFAHYCAAKAGLEMLGRAIAVELGGRGVRCNTIVPGTIDTPLTAEVGLDDEQHARLLSRTPANRLGEPDEVAHGAVWLACAPEFVNGASLVIDGGYSVEGTP